MDKLPDERARSSEFCLWRVAETAAVRLAVDFMKPGSLTVDLKSNSGKNELTPPPSEAVRPNLSEEEAKKEEGMGKAERPSSIVRCGISLTDSAVRAGS